MTTLANVSTSNGSLRSDGSFVEDWDRTIVLDESNTPLTPGAPTFPDPVSAPSPRNSIAFPVEGDHTDGATLGITFLGVRSRSKRSLSELLRLHAEEGTECNFTPEEVSRLGEVLGQWINAGTSPYEVEDDFFGRSQDDSSIRVQRSMGMIRVDIRPRGQSASSRPSSSTSHS